MTKKTIADAKMLMSELKKQAGYLAADQIENGMAVGLGTGSTAYFAIERLAERIKTVNLKVNAVSTSFSTTLLCHSWKIPLLDISTVQNLDLAIDGADEIDEHRNVIKGRGAAHTLEKIVAGMADKFIIVADESKKVKQLGASMPVPVEVLPSALQSAIRKIQGLGAEKCVLRMAEKGKDGPIISDNGNFIIDAFFKNIQDSHWLELGLNHVPGVLDNGIFAGYATQVILATELEGIKVF